MIAAARRYKQRLLQALATSFPRTTAYLRESEPFGAPKVPLKGPARGKGDARPGKPAPHASDPAKPVRPRQTDAANAIYGPGLLLGRRGSEQAMRQRVAEAVAAGLVSAPSDEQWAMILAREPLVRIFAGAGSGKSTTLVLRSIYLLCHLRVPAERLTVISFTNESCAQLRSQLVRLLAFWQLPFDEDQARQCVRTFHSALAALAREMLGQCNWLELMDQRPGTAGEPDNPLAGGGPGVGQQQLLKAAYQHCYGTNAVFRQKVHALLGLPADRVLTEAPLDGFRLAGEWKKQPLLDAFHTQGSFIESLGIRIRELDTEGLDCPPQERDFLEALKLFWQALDDHLERARVVSFNGAFQRLTELLEKGSVPDCVPLGALSHLLIDEFQDISPIILRWLQAVHRRLVGDGQRVSLMAIGDDWQSIYGWRGSSPELFLDFDRHFPGCGRAAKSRVLRLETNYRSVEPVIRDAEKALAGVALKQGKASRAFHPAGKGDHGLRLRTGFDVRHQLPQLLAEIRRQCAHAAARRSCEQTAVLVLSRRNQPLKAIRQGLDRDLPVRLMTIHRAKGLQAEVAIILDEAAPATAHPLRNAVYASCGFFRNSYDQAMRDEQLRLAYVAVTRGVSRVLWLTREQQGPDWC